MEPFPLYFYFLLVFFWCVCVCVHIYTNKKKPDTKGYDVPRVGSNHSGIERQILGWPKSSSGIFYKML